MVGRKGSVGFPGKNIFPVLGRPLAAYPLLAAKESDHIEKIFVSTDSKKIAKEAIKYGAIVPFIRPKNLAKDTTPEILVWRHAISFLNEKLKINPDYIVSLPTTSPLRKLSDINACIKKSITSNLDVLFTATESSRNPFFNMIKKQNKKISTVCSKSSKKYTRRQDAPTCYDLCTVCYVFKPKFILKNKDLYSGNVDFFEVSKKSSIDIDTRFDYKLAKLLYNYNL